MFTVTTWYHVLEVWPAKLKGSIRRGAMAYTCSLGYSGWDGRMTWAQEFKSSLGNIVKTLLQEGEKGGGAV